MPRTIVQTSEQLYFGGIDGLGLLSREEESELGKLISPSYVEGVIIKSAFSYYASAFEGLEKQIASSSQKQIPVNVLGSKRIYKVSDYADMSKQLVSQYRVDGNQKKLVDAVRSAQLAGCVISGAISKILEDSAAPPVLSAYVQEYLQKRENARKRMVEGNVYLVVSIAKEYMHRFRGFSFLDIVAEGNVGLIEAIDRFDVSRNCRFSTYATWWVRHHIKRVRRDYHPVGLVVPEKVRAELGAAGKAVENLLTATPEEIAEVAETVGIQPFRLERAIALLMTGKSNGDDIIARLAAPQPEDTALLSEGIQNALSSLTEKEQFVIKARYGIGVAEQTLEEISRQIECTKENVRQIELRAMKKLKENSKLEELLE